MSVWSSLFGEAARVELTPPSPGRPSVVTAVRYKLVVTFFAHELAEAEGSFLSAVTSGLRNQKQRELVLTVRLPSTDDIRARMQELLAFFVSIQHLARARKLVHAGGFTHFKERGLFGRKDSGLLYASARPIPGVDMPDDALALILVDGAELRTAIDYGAYRVLSRIGARERCFPFPTWNALDRPSVVGEREHESVLGKVPRIRMPGVSFIAERQSVRVLLSPLARSAGRSLSALSPGAPFALLIEPAASANAVYVWHPGQQEPAGVIAPGGDGSRMTGSCLMIVPGGQESQARPFEDGYSLMFATAAWSEISFALRDQRALALKLADGTALEFVWQNAQAIR